MPLSTVMQDICSEFGVSKHFNLRKVHIDSIRVLSDIVRVLNIVLCLAKYVCVATCVCLSVPDAIITLQVHHIPTV